MSLRRRYRLRSPPPELDTPPIERCLKAAENNLSLAFFQCLITSCDISSTEMYVQDKSPGYLDLALVSSCMTNWRRSVTTTLHASLPFLSREYFLAETPALLKRFTNLRNKLVSHNNQRRRGFGKRLSDFNKQLFIDYENSIFQNIEKDGEVLKQSIYKYLRLYKIVRIDRFRDAYPQFCTLLCTNPPLDPVLTVDMLRVMCNTEYKMKNALRLVGTTSELESLLCQAADRRFDFWGLWRGVGDLAPRFDFVFYYMALRVDPRYLNILLKYGFPYTTGPRQFMSRYRRLSEIEFEGRDVILSVNVFARHAGSEKMTRMILIIDTFLIFGNFERTAGAVDRINTLKYLTRSLPLPYVTPTELYDTMLEAVVPYFQPQLQAIVFNYANADIFDDDINTYMPRRLEHLCRIAVRKILADKFMLLDGIQKLPITKQLRRYLELES